MDWTYWLSKGGQNSLSTAPKLADQYILVGPGSQNGYPGLTLSDTGILLAKKAATVRTSLTLFVISGCLALCVSYVSANLGSRFAHRAEVVHNQFAILNGQPLVYNGDEYYVPQFQSRILFPLALAAVSRIPVLKPTAWYLLLRIATAWLGLGLFMGVCMRRGAALKVAAIGTGMLCYALVFTFYYGWEYPEDFIDVAAFSVFLWLALEHKRWLLAAAVIVDVTNHQTALFGAVIWFFLNVSRCNCWREAIYSGSVAVLGYSLSIMIARVFSRGAPLVFPGNGYQTIIQFRDFMRHPQPFAWPFLLMAMLIPVSMWLSANRATVNVRLVWAAVVIVAISSPLAFWAELRSVWLAPIIVLTFAATVAEGCSLNACIPGKPNTPLA